VLVLHDEFVSWVIHRLLILLYENNVIVIFSSLCSNLSDKFYFYLFCVGGIILLAGIDLVSLTIEG
jgi:hypothetical protein